MSLANKITIISSTVEVIVGFGIAFLGLALFYINRENLGDLNTLAGLIAIIAIGIAFFTFGISIFDNLETKDSNLRMKKDLKEIKDLLKKTKIITKKKD